MKKQYDVIGIGNPLIDLLSQVSDELLSELGLNKGIMHLIDFDRRQVILDKLEKIKITPGGSCANTIISTADFGLNSIYSGSIGEDEFGNQFERGLEKIGVKSDLCRKTLSTGSSIILISNDAERTQNTYLGACQEYTKEDINEEMIKQSKYLYFAGYMWDTESQKEALARAINIAKKNQTKIVFDVADPFAVNRSKEDFLAIIKNDVDFVLSNFEEAKSMTGKEEKNEVLKSMMELNPNGVVKDGGNGSYIYSDGQIYEIPAYDVTVVDTTGAGDMYAAGIIYGLVKGYDMERTGRIASYSAAKIVENIGPRLEFSLKEVVDTL